MFVSWGPGMEGTSTIQVWEPERHLRILENRPNAPRKDCEGGIEAVVDAKPVEVAVDYYLEAKGGGTVLRLVHSGFGTESSWDHEFESTHYGWMMYLRTLRHALTRHPGVPCRQAMKFVATALDPKEAWARVMGPKAFLASGSVEGLKEGDRFHWRAANGDEISGAVQMCFPPTYIGGTIEQANDSLFGITAMPNIVMLTFMFYGLGEAEAQTIQSRWEQLVKQAQ
jgi:hypothetical protein